MNKNNSNKKKEVTEENKGRDYKGIIATICTVITMLMTGVTIFFTHQNNLEIRKLNNNRYNLESYVSYDLTCDIKCEGEESASLIINKNGETVKTTVPPIVISQQIGGIKKAYAVYYHDGSFWEMEKFEENGFPLDQHNASDLMYMLDEYSLDYEAVDNSGNWYGTIYIVIQDYNDKYYYNMLVYKMNSDNKLLDCTVYDELQAKMLCNSENFRVTNMYASEMMKEFNSLVAEVDSSGLDKDN